MLRTTRLALLSVASLALCFCWLSTADAGLVTFSNFSQSGQAPGDPANPFGTPTVVGNSLTFTGPNSFSATSSGGVFSNVDSFSDGFLSFSVTADDETWITGFSMSETGLSSLVDLGGGGSDDTFVSVIAAGQIFVTELDHGNTNLTAAAAMPIDIGFNLTNDFIMNPGTGFWSDSDFQSIEDALVANGVSFTFGATAFDFVLNNQLIAVSENGDPIGTLAFIDKKRVGFEVSTQMVPEATSFLLFATSIGMTCIRRKRSS